MASRFLLLFFCKYLSLASSSFTISSVISPNWFWRDAISEFKFSISFAPSLASLSFSVIWLFDEVMLSVKELMLVFTVSSCFVFEWRSASRSSISSLNVSILSWIESFFTSRIPIFSLIWFAWRLYSWARCSLFVFSIWTLASSTWRSLNFVCSSFFFSLFSKRVAWISSISFWIFVRFSSSSVF